MASIGQRHHTTLTFSTTSTIRDLSMAHTAPSWTASTIQYRPLPRRAPMTTGVSLYNAWGRKSKIHKSCSSGQTRTEWQIKGREGCGVRVSFVNDIAVYSIWLCCMFNPRLLAIKAKGPGKALLIYEDHSRRVLSGRVAWLPYSTVQYTSPKCRRGSAKDDPFLIAKPVCRIASAKIAPTPTVAFPSPDHFSVEFRRRCNNHQIIAKDSLKLIKHHDCATRYKWSVLSFSRQASSEPSLADNINSLGMRQQWLPLGKAWRYEQLTSTSSALVNHALNAIQQISIYVGWWRSRGGYLQRDQAWCFARRDDQHADV